MAEGERDKVIQCSTKIVISTKNPDNQAVNNSQPKNKPVESHQPTQSLNSVPFPSTFDKTANVNPDPEDETQTQAYGQGQHPRKPQGAYREMNEGLVAAMAQSDNLQNMDLSANEPENDEINLLPPDFALIGGLNSEPGSLEEALRGPNAKEWQTALEYEIDQLEKLGTWIVEDLPKQHTAIPCGEVLKIKRGPNGEVQSYRVHIVAGGHRQAEGVNYSETFSAAAKMPTVPAVLTNAAEQDWEIEHVDVKSAYLNAPLKETVYMKALCGVLKLW